MTELQQAIASGQVSAAQIEAHRAAGELPIVMIEPRFQHTYCSQCLKDCGPGMDGVSGCADHIADVQPSTGCTCKWNGEVSESRCELHEAWHVAILEWSDRAKAAEAEIAALRSDVERYRHIQRLTRAVYDVEADQRFILPAIRKRPGQDLMRGSVSQHLDEAIDAAIKATS